ncbi:hypothetical protein D3C87_1844030 [compost metagenome]
MIHAAIARLFEQARHGEATHAAALVVGVDVDAPQYGAEMLLRVFEVEVAADERDDLLAVDDDALPRRLRVHHRRGDAVADRGEERLLARLERHIVDGHDRRGGQFDESQITHGARLAPLPGSGTVHVGV